MIYISNDNEFISSAPIFPRENISCTWGSLYILGITTASVVGKCNLSFTVLLLLLNPLFPWFYICVSPASAVTLKMDPFLKTLFSYLPSYPFPLILHSPFPSILFYKLLSSSLTTVLVCLLSTARNLIIFAVRKIRSCTACVAMT